MSGERVPPAPRVGAIERHTADIRIRVAQLRWMIDHGRLDEADQAIRDIRLSLAAIAQSIDQRRAVA